ncbi:hypothetical protein [Streptomyces sp. NPDC048357]|uniref:hypothetical protein n=1 Tax=Streptomyces sp. NPDC048357 TaxID=3154719 RepID=UPI003429D9E0
MSGADEDVPAGAREVWAPLSGFAEAAAVVLATPSECREAMLGALDRCWEELRQVGRHRPPYANDAAELFDRFESARGALQLALWAAAAAGPPPGGGVDAAVDRAAPGPVAQADLAGAANAEARPGSEPPSAPDGPPSAADVSDPAPADPDRSPTGAGASGAEPAPGTQSQPSDAGPAAAGPDPQPPSGDAAPGPAEVTAPTPDAAGGPEPAAGNALPTPDDDPLAGFADALSVLEAELFAEQIRYLPRSPHSVTAGPSATTGTATADRIAATWQRVHMALLRLPATLRTEWRAHADEAAAAAGLAVTAEDSADPDVIVPGLPQGLYAAERVPLTIAAPQVAASRVPAEIHLTLGTSADTVMDLPSADPRLAWAVRADQALRLVELDPELHFAALVEEQPSSLAPQDERVRYRQHLDRLLGSAGSSQASGWPADGRLGAAHNLDMVLGGLVHKRPAAPGSWWWQWRTAVSRILAPLAASAGYELVLKPVGQWRKHDLESYAVKQTVPGVGQAEEPLVQWVVWTPLKPKSSYTRNERKGRVVIRPVTQYGRQAAP